METTIPFGGFYESIWDQEIDSIAEREAEYMTSDEGEYSDFEDDEVWQVMFDHTNHQALEIEVAKLYVDAWQDLINGELGIDIRISFNLMVSPKEYNFTTNRIFVQISSEDVQRLRVEAPETALAQAAKDKRNTIRG